MSIYHHQAAFGMADKTTAAMRSAMDSWKALYYGTHTEGEDPCQRLAYTIVTKLTKAVFGEYTAQSGDPVTRQLLKALEPVRLDSFSTALVEGECYLKPWAEAEGFRFGLIPGSNVLVFSVDSTGVPTDVGLMETSVQGEDYYTLLERRSVDPAGMLTVSYQLYRSRSGDNLGQQVSLRSHPLYEDLPECYTFPEPVGSVGLVRMKMPVVNCVDGSFRGVSVFAAAQGLIHNIDRNESQLCGEFDRGESRIIASRDLLGAEGLQDHVFVGLDEDPESVGITVFAPQLRHEAYLARKQEYLRNVESIVGLRRGMLSDANVEERTATEIASSTADFNLTVLQLQQMWEAAVCGVVDLCRKLSKAYDIPSPEGDVSIDWGNGVLYDETAQWEQYMTMVGDGILKPEIALGWRFGMPTDTPQQLETIRNKFMPA